MSDVRSFPPIEGVGARVLVLGTMPGVASLQRQAYYAHPRNAFWPIVLAWLDGTPPNARAALELPYETRVERLRQGGVAVWDVLASCRRPGSLDGAIERASERANDIASLLDRHTRLERIVCNGRTAERLLARHVEPSVRERVSVTSAPSTSPAMASLGLVEKYRRWCEALG